MLDFHDPEGGQDVALTHTSIAEELNLLVPLARSRQLK